MVALKLFVFTLLSVHILAHIRVEADASFSDVVDEVKVAASDGPDSSLLEQLKTKIQSLESHIEEKTREIKEKDRAIADKEKIIKEKSDSIVSLESEVAALHRKGKLDAAEQVGKPQVRAGKLEKQVEKLRKDIDVKIKENELLEARATEAEKKASELSSKFESLQKITDDQKAKIRKTQRALEIAEEELMKAKFEATSKTNELMEVYGAWLPSWLAVHVTYYQSLLKEHWKVRGKPALEMLLQKAVEKKVQAEEWSAPHVETVKTKWIPAIKEQCVVIATNIEPHVQTLTTKTVEIYQVSKDTLTPHIIKVQEIANLYFQELRKISKPYIDQVATAARPHIDKLHSALKPHTEKAVHAYRKFLESATTYHLQVQDIVQDKLNNHELTKPLATKELVWFSASALLALPIIFLPKIFSAIFGKTGKKRTRQVNSNNPRRKGKRIHPDKSNPDKSSQ